MRRRCRCRVTHSWYLRTAAGLECTRCGALQSDQSTGGMMLKRLWAWVRHREPVAAVAGVVAVVGGVLAPAIADLPPSASWTAVASAIALALVRQLVTPA